MECEILVLYMLAVLVEHIDLALLLPLTYITMVQLADSLGYIFSPKDQLVLIVQV